MLLASLYISRHGRLVQTSNNQAGPRTWYFYNDLHFKCACTDLFVLVQGKCRKKLFLFPPFIRTNGLPPHSFVATPVLPFFHDLTLAHKRVLPPIVEKFHVFCSVQSRPNTIANQQSIVIWHNEGRWNATCHELSCLEAGHRPL